MLFDPKQGHRAGELEDELRRAQAVTPELIAAVVAQACPRLAACGARVQAEVKSLIAAGAWLDAALALCKLELPQWTLRRAVYEDGQWLCSLSQQPALPLDLDDAIEACHEMLPLALLIALVEARQAAAVRAVVASSVPQVRPTAERPVCCDNFS
jgi:hypothetical protein